MPSLPYFLIPVKPIWSVLPDSPGTGKSTLVAQLAKEFRNPTAPFVPQKVGILAIDPTSPFSGGAVLGDRVRMRDLAGDEGIFIRSMASRGALGGLSAATAAAAEVLDAAGYDVILIETVGAGQDDVEIVRLAHTTLVVEAPDLGDEIQAIKAGILEIADILVLNKADLPGVARAERALRSALELADTSRPFTENIRSSSDPGLKRVLSGKPDGDRRWSRPSPPPVMEHPNCIRQSWPTSSISWMENLWDEKDAARLTNELEHHLRENLFGDWQKGIDPDIYQKVLEKCPVSSSCPLNRLRLIF